ncbi:hypothetical protein B0H13DRAFT_1903173 [Mycena leptocephala]|nr:hypothetical protein B0H13DRAFT_1903173 [Mycena leptocephala]
MPAPPQRNATPGPSSGPDTGSASEPQTGEKRTADDRGSPLQEPPSAKKSRQEATKKAQPYQLRKIQIPEKFKNTKNCGYLHGYILLGIVSAKVAAASPDAAHIAKFNSRSEPGFLAALEDKLRTQSNEQTGAAKMVSFVRKAAKAEDLNGGLIAKQILLIPESCLLAIYSAVLSAGLDHWQPDMLSPPDTIYNRIHQMVYTHTFKFALAAFAYRFLQPTPSAFNNDALINDIFLSFTFFYMRGKSKAELKAPGKLLRNNEDNNTSRRRKTLGKNRVTFALMDKQPERVVMMLKDQRCHSDDEEGSDREHHIVYWVNKKGPRSASATTFIHANEPRRIKTQRGKKKGKKEERMRRADPDAVESEMSQQIPAKTTVDWFDPDYFNDLPAKMRFEYAQNGVALPLIHLHGNTDYKMMNNDAFMAAYGNDVLALYNIPTTQEMEMDL